MAEILRQERTKFRAPKAKKPICVSAIGLSAFSSTYRVVYRVVLFAAFPEISRGLSGQCEGGDLNPHGVTR